MSMPIRRRVRDLVVRFWCRKHHDWTGWQMTPEERGRVVCPVDRNRWGRVTMVHGVTVASWSRRPCRFCRGLDWPAPTLEGGGG